MAQRTGHIEQLTEAYGIDASFIAVAHDLLTVFYACLHSTEILNISPPQSRNIQSTEITMDIDDVGSVAATSQAPPPPHFASGMAFCACGANFAA
jgi:hypothetical protein